MNSQAKIGICVAIVMALFSCKKDNNFPITPILKVKDFHKIDQTKALWTLEFTDGDGDVGVRNESDPDNFIVEIWVIKNDSAYLDTNLQASNYRVPVVRGIRTAKGVKGEIELTLEGLDFILAAGFDSIFYSGHLLDRSMNASNTVQTPVFSTK